MKTDRRTVVKSMLALPVISNFLTIKRIPGLKTTHQRVFKICIIGETGRGDFGHEMDMAWLAIPNTEIIAVSDRDPVGLKKALNRLRIDKGYLDYKEMLAKEKPDIVCVAPRWVDKHFEMVKDAIQAGVKGIYMEKPFCRNLKEADEIVALCKQSKVKLALAHRNRYHPALPTVKRLIQEGHIGELIEIRGRGKEDSRGGPQDLWVLGSHVLNLISVFSGEFVACTAQIYSNNEPATRADLREGAEGVGKIVGNALHARFETTSGISVFFDSIKDKKSEAADFGFRIYGTKGLFEFRVDQEPLVFYSEGNDLHNTSSSKTWLPVSSEGINKTETFPDLKKQLTSHNISITDLINSITHDTYPLCNELEGKATIEAIMATFESHRLHGQRVVLPLTIHYNPLEK